jgi:hypothetical protein
MSLPDFSEAAVNGIPLLFMVIGLVEYIKKFGISGDLLTASSMVIGLVLGVGYQISIVGSPASFADGFALIVYGLALGLVASGIYDTLKELLGQ